jgi:hypothetical protein
MQRTRDQQTSYRQSFVRAADARRYAAIPLERLKHATTQSSSFEAFGAISPRGLFHYLCPANHQVWNIVLRGSDRPITPSGRFCAYDHR